MIVSTFQYKRPAGIVGQLNLSKVRSFGDRELAIIGAWVKDLTEGSEAKSEDLKSLLTGEKQMLPVRSGDFYLTRQNNWLIVNNSNLEPYITESR